MAESTTPRFRLGPFCFFQNASVLHGAVSTFGHQGLLWLSGLKGLRNPHQFMELPLNPRMPWKLPLAMPWTLGV